MDNITFYSLCYKTLSGRIVETDILFKNDIDAYRYANCKNNAESNWWTKYFVKTENIHLYSSFSEIAQEKDRQRLLSIFFLYSKTTYIT